MNLYKDNDFVSIANGKVLMNYTKKWTNNGHTFGEGLISPDKNHFYINIPKNASSSIKQNLLKLNWDFGNVTDYPNATPIVPLRDPIARWKSGIVEYLMMYHQQVIFPIVEPNIYKFLPLLGEKLALSLIFDTITFDDHTERQCVFLKDLDLSTMIFLNVDNAFNKNFSSLLNGIGYNGGYDVLTMENNSAGSGKSDIKELFSLIIKKDKHKAKQLRDWFWCDYELMEQVKFYESSNK